MGGGGTKTHESFTVTPSMADDAASEATAGPEPHAVEGVAQLDQVHKLIADLGGWCGTGHVGGLG